MPYRAMRVMLLKIRPSVETGQNSRTDRPKTRIEVGLWNGAQDLKVQNRLCSGVLSDVIAHIFFCVFHVDSHGLGCRGHVPPFQGVQNCLVLGEGGAAPFFGI